MRIFFAVIFVYSYAAWATIVGGAGGVGKCWRIDQTRTANGSSSPSTYWIYKNKTRMDFKENGTQGYTLFDGTSSYLCFNGGCMHLGKGPGGLFAGTAAMGVDARFTNISVTKTKQTKKIKGQTCTVHNIQSTVQVKMNIMDKEIVSNTANNQTSCHTLGAGYADYIKHIRPMLQTVQTELVTPGAVPGLRDWALAGLELESHSVAVGSSMGTKIKITTSLRTNNIAMVPCKLVLFQTPAPGMLMANRGSKKDKKLGKVPACDCETEMNKITKEKWKGVDCDCVEDCKSHPRVGKALRAAKIDKKACERSLASADDAEDLESDIESGDTSEDTEAQRPEKGKPTKIFEEALKEKAKSFLPF